MSTDQPRDAPPHKRLRTEQDSDSPPQPSTTAGTGSSLNNLKRHAEFWLEDGSVILITRNTGFRVYRALLAAQSTVFADMFSSSSPDATEMLDGCPVVHISDAPRDVAQFFRVLLPKAQPTEATNFRPRSLFSRKFRFSLHQISAIIRLAHKYHVQPVLDQAIAALAESFPSDFDTWERGDHAVRFRNEHAIGVIALASLMNRPSFLPITYYRCALLGGDLVDGYKRENKTIERLDGEKTKRCIDGRNNLVSRALGVLLLVFNVTPCMDCETRDTCGRALQTMQNWALEEDKATDADVLQSWRYTIEEWALDTTICHHCEKDLNAKDVRERKEVWKDLPVIFDIEVEVGDWDTNSASDFSDSSDD